MSVPSLPTSVSFRVARVGGELACWRTGAGQPALLLHGGPGMSDYTESLAAELAEGVGLEVVRFQQRGLEPTTLRGPYEVEEFVADAVAVLDAMAAEDVWLIGHSWGGHLAMHVACTVPERFTALVVIDPLGAVGDGGMAEASANELERLPPDVRRRYTELESEIAQADAEHQEALVLEQSSLAWPYCCGNLDSPPPMPLFRFSVECFTDTMLSWTRHFEQHTLERRLPELAVPTLFIHGAASMMPLTATQASAELVRDARLEVVDRAGHYIWLDQPGAIADAVSRFEAVPGVQKPRNKPDGRGAPTTGEKR